MSEKKDKSAGTSWFEKIKKFLRRLWYRIIFLFNPKSKKIPKKIRKKWKKREETKRGKRLFSVWSRLAELMFGYRPETGCRLLKKKKHKKDKKHAGAYDIRLSLAAT